MTRNEKVARFTSHIKGEYYSSWSEESIASFFAAWEYDWSKAEDSYRVTECECRPYSNLYGELGLEAPTEEEAKAERDFEDRAWDIRMDAPTTKIAEKQIAELRKAHFARFND